MVHANIDLIMRRLIARSTFFDQGWGCEKTLESIVGLLGAFVPRTHPRYDARLQQLLNDERVRNLRLKQVRSDATHAVAKRMLQSSNLSTIIRKNDDCNIYEGNILKKKLKTQNKKNIFIFYKNRIIFIASAFIFSLC